MPARLLPSRLAFAPGGTPWSEVFGDVYHSADGGPGQARHVFLGGNEIPSRWRGRERFVILETGFGLGLNFLATWAEWRADPDRCGRLHFVSAEKHPFSATDLATLHSRHPEFVAPSQELLNVWPVLTPGFHRLHFDAGRVTLTLLLGDAFHCLRQLNAAADAVYLDGFAPEKNPEMWSHQLFRALSRLVKPGASLATWTVATAVREALAATGFATEKRPGFGRKREMLAGRYQPSPRVPRIGQPPEIPERRAVIIGAGPAGAAAGERLASRGWEVELIERRPAPRPEDSAQLAGIIHPVVSRDDNIVSRLSRAGHLYALRLWCALAAEGLPLRWSDCGVLQVARNPDQQHLYLESTEELGFPKDYVSCISTEEAGPIVGHHMAAGGLLFPAAGWVNPPSLCRALAERHKDRVRVRFGIGAATLERGDGAWIVRDARGAAIAEAPVAVLANAFDATAFAQASNLPFRRIRGQVSFIPVSDLTPPRLVLCGNGYLTPALEGASTLGATYDFDDDDPGPRVSGHESNLARLESLLPGGSAGIDAATLTGRVGFRCATPDRLPLAGSLAVEEETLRLRPGQLRDIPRWPGLHALLGYGSRGLVWAAIAAELLASQLEGDPLPLESDLVDAVDPARFLLRAIRRGRL
ncbi:MAG: bifunctional tRNA (5-methylaminomethyl-2-thiouridine)(34)-methyltransferase MnmD/FAD-dependent 5-carboxymethylaminomethyl-2-thiouridine(34) oxidoreductase MnmC [Betaproteobacteria bacterium]|nr:bifunctional tRNA (5-methylaminomethyl-2-thiouridine)(34)-methyltransferase MnmD/FAD-dependent 5-carboxymethylaminomethyl-2-thiouridine(34) oxidoreductase MnmC [Betaproteobacteria bacterium]